MFHICAKRSIIRTSVGKWLEKRSGNLHPILNTGFPQEGIEFCEGEGLKGTFTLDLIFLFWIILTMHYYFYNTYNTYYTYKYYNTYNL